jgi:hypothetical protein
MWSGRCRSQLRCSENAGDPIQRRSVVGAAPGWGFEEHARASPGGKQRRRAAALHRRRPFERGGWRTGSQACLPGTIYRAPTKAKSWAKRRKRAGETPALQEDDARSGLMRRARPGEPPHSTGGARLSEADGGQVAKYVCRARYIVPLQRQSPGRREEKEPARRRRYKRTTPVPGSMRGAGPGKPGG